MKSNVSIRNFVREIGQRDCRFLSRRWDNVCREMIRLFLLLVDSKRSSNSSNLGYQDFSKVPFRFVRIPSTNRQCSVRSMKTVEESRSLLNLTDSKPVEFLLVEVRDFRKQFLKLFLIVSRNRCRAADIHIDVEEYR